MTLEALLWLLAIILISVVVAILAVICTPVRILAFFDTTEKPAAIVKVSIFGGLIAVPMTTKGDATKKKKKAQQTQMKKRRSRWTANWRAGVPAIPRLISRLTKRVNIEEIDAEIRFGLDDPADTGLIYGLVVPVAMWAGGKDNVEIAVRPDFEKARLDGDGKLAVRFTPFLVIIPLIRFGWTVFIPKRFHGVYS